MRKGEVKHVPTLNKERYAIIKCFDLLTDIDHKSINETFPFNGITRPLTCFRALMMVAANPGITNTSLKNKVRHQDVKYGTERLVELGYITTVVSPRYIPCFNRHKLTTGFVITNLGVKVLNDLLPVYDPLTQTA